MLSLFFSFTMFLKILSLRVITTQAGLKTTKTESYQQSTNACFTCKTSLRISTDLEGLSVNLPGTPSVCHSPRWMLVLLPLPLFHELDHNNSVCSGTHHHGH